MNKIVLGVCGSLASTAVPGYVLVLKTKFKDAEIMVLLTKSARYFLAPGALAHLPGVSVIDVAKYYHSEDQSRTNHADVVKNCDLFLVLPATANFLGKAANGIADDLLSTCFLAYAAPKLIFPAMNADMLKSRYVQKNIQTLRSFGERVVLGGEGFSVSSGEIGPGAMPDVRTVLANVDMFIRDGANKS
ncbi:flavoprotein [Xanthomonas oryzae]|uniref:flavoprotein n=1 Tax=Xanthomonas oryzae TaxID=347 RepID=UPI001033D8CE|nr:flavoprotein [Xanthomonas oryzae]QBH05528.1 hypothetical protein EYC57_22310 [Xanthomonas oryzae]